MMKEKTTPKSVAPHKVKGAVLFTVVCVMMVLIVFLMGTLALAATANRRANINFQKEQTETIAKTVLTTVADAINEDKSGSTTGINAKVANAADSPFDITVTIPGEPKPFKVSIKKVNNQRSVFDSATHKFVDCEMYELTTTVKTNAENPASDSTFSMYLSYGEGTGSTHTSSGGGGGGAFIASGDLNGPMGTSGLTTGGTQIGLNNKPGDNKTYSWGHGTGTQESPVYINGNLDTSVRCRVYFPGYGIDPQREYFAVNGNLTINQEYEMIMDPSQKLPGQTYAWDPSLQKSYDFIPSLLVKDCFNIICDGQQMIIGDETSPVNIYCGWFDDSAGGMDVRITGDMFCFNPDKTSTFNGQACKNKRLYNYAARSFQKPDKSVVTDYIWGNIYSKGNLKFDKVRKPDATGEWTIGGSVCCEKQIDIIGGDDGAVLTINGDLVGTTINISNKVTVRCQNVYADTVTVGADCQIILTSATPERAYAAADKKALSSYTNPLGSNSVFPTGYNLNDLFDVIVNAPNVDLSSTDTDNNVFADESMYPHSLTGYSTYFENITTGGGGVSLPEIVGDLKWGHQNAQKRIGGTWVQVNPWYGYWDGATYENVEVDDAAHITTSCVLDNKQNSGSEVIYIDTEAAHGDITVYIQNKFTLDGGGVIVINDTAGDVNFYVPKDATFDVRKGMIITTSYLEKMLGKDPTSDPLTLDDIKSANMSILSNIKGDLIIDQYSTDSYYPNVYVYGEEDSTMNVGSAGNAFVTMNIRAPYLDFSADTAVELGTNGGSITYRENGIDKSIDGKKFSVLGQIIANDINVSNAFGLIYVTDSNGNGKTILPTVVGGGSYTSKVFRTMYYNFY